MTSILGISGLYHDSAAALIVDGQVVVAAQEERFTREKHDASLPAQAIAHCLREANLTPKQLDFVGFYEKPLLTFERLLETYLAVAPRGFASFVRAMPVWLREKLYVSRELNRLLPGRRRRIVYTQHHQSHAASAFFPSPFERAAILTLDGVGEWATASCGVGEGNRITLHKELHFPHSLGLLYSAFTYFCGFKVNSGEYKLMGLAPYGRPCYADLIREKLIDLRDDGSFRLDLSYFNYCQGLTMTSRRFDRLFGGVPRTPETELTQREMDLAASIQVVTEEVMLRMARYVHQITSAPNLCLAGGVALNCVGNGRILREGPFEHLWIQPAAGDAGGALGVAWFIWHQLLDNPREPQAGDSQGGSLLGPRYQEAEIESLLDAQAATYQHVPDEAALFDQVVELLSQGKVVGWFQGAMEFGPRALGNRSILADPRDPRIQSVLNLKIKRRESFRPFAPAVLQEVASDWFDLPPGTSSPYMLLVAPVHEAKRLNVGDDGALGLDRLQVPRSLIPAVTHVDDSARVQTVDAERNPRFHGLITAFAKQTGCPLLVNTSFNVRGEPIVCTPAEAYRCFLTTDMDVLVMERYVVVKRGDETTTMSPSQFAPD